MTPQEIFDFAVTHLHSMPGRCANENGCLYLDPQTGNRCAVGAFFPLLKEVPAYIVDRLDKEEANVRVIAQTYKRLPSWFTDNDLLLRDLQYAHDNSSNWKNGKFVGDYQLANIAAHYRLELNGAQA